MSLIRAIVLQDFRTAANALTVTGVSTGYSIGSCGDNLRQMFAGMHITVANGGASSTSRVLQMTYQNASSSAFGTITTAAIFALSTAQAAEWLPPTAVGSLSTDKPWWRANWTLSTANTTAGNWQGLAWIGFR